MFVCLFVCSITKMNDPKVFKLGIGNKLVYTRSDMDLNRGISSAKNAKKTNAA